MSEPGSERLIKELRAALARMETALDAIPEALVWTDARGSVEWCNLAFERLAGRTRIECLGRLWSTLCALRPLPGGQGVFELSSASSSARVELEGSEVAGGSGARVFLLRDVGPRLELELSLRESARALEIKNRELDSFAYTAAHDLRAPARQIGAWGELLAKGYGKSLDERGRELLGRIGESSRRMIELINGLLELARLSSARLAPATLDLSRLAVEIADGLAAREPARRVRFTAQPGLSAVGDETLVRSLLSNLLENAWKFTGKTAAPRVEFGQEPDGAFFVRDNGAGFDMAYKHKLFTPFQRLHTQTEFSGTGIGLATVSRIVELHGGAAWGESSPGGGATFRFTLKA